VKPWCFWIWLMCFSWWLMVSILVERSELTHFSVCRALVWPLFCTYYLVVTAIYYFMCSTTTRKIPK
jgi:hypothetical protein